MERNEKNISQKEMEILDQLNLEMIQYYQQTYPDEETKTPYNLDYYTYIDETLRFMNARDFDPPQAFQMWKNWVTWHQQYRPFDIKQDQEIIQKSDCTGQLMWHKHDQEKRPILYYRMKFNVANIGTVDENVRYVVYMLQKGIREAEKLGSNKVMVIYDRRGFQKDQSDDTPMQTMQKVIPIFQDYYPERLFKFYVIGANWAAYAVVSTFMSKQTTQKVQVLADQSDLLKYIDEDQLITDYGGKSVLTWPQDTQLTLNQIQQAGGDEQDGGNEDFDEQDGDISQDKQKEIIKAWEQNK